MGARTNHGKAKSRKAQDGFGNNKDNMAFEYTDYEPLRRSSRLKPGHEPPRQVTSNDDERSSYNETRARRKIVDGQPSKKKSRLAPGRIEDYDDEYLNSPMNDFERREWKGWCEIESDPAFFNSIIKEWGVKGVKIQEVIGLDDELLTFLPKPIYGLIFLFQYREDGPEKMEKCPDNVWFAHQIAQNSCASVALLNLIMNIPNVEVGDVIESLRRDTGADMSPQQRGQVVKNCEFVRNVHNSFARKSDLFTEVKDMKQPTTPQKAVKRKRRSNGFTNKKRKKATDEEEESAFHFIAFVPINGKLWKLDGMDAQPMNLGPFEDDWMDLARPEISARMAAYEDDAINFSLQAVCCSPLETLPTLLAENIAQLLSIESELASKDPDWTVYLDPGSSTASVSHLLHGPDENAGVTPELLARAKSNVETSENTNPKITRPQNSVMELMDMREKTVREQHKLYGVYMEEIVAVQQDEERAKSRRQYREDLSVEKQQQDEERTKNGRQPREYSSRTSSSISQELLAGASYDPLAEYKLPSSPAPKDTSSTEATEPLAVDTDSNPEMKDAANEKQDSESSLDIPLNAALTIHSDGLAAPAEVQNFSV